MTQHNIQKYGAPRVHILPFRFYEPCKKKPSPEDSASDIQNCPSVNNNFLEDVATKTSRHSRELRFLGKEKITALWKYMRDRELQFIKSPTPANAELNLSMDILNGIDQSPRSQHQPTSEP